MAEVTRYADTCCDVSWVPEHIGVQTGLEMILSERALTQYHFKFMHCSTSSQTDCMQLIGGAATVHFHWCFCQEPTSFHIL